MAVLRKNILKLFPEFCENYTVSFRKIDNFLLRVIVCVAVLLQCALLLFFTLDVGLLARIQYSEGPTTGHLDKGFSRFPCV